MTDLEKSYEEFWDELLLEAEASKDLQATAFFDLYANLAAQNGDCGDLEYCPVRKEGPRGYQIDGYSIDTDIGELVIAICDFRDDRELQPLNSANIETIFRKAERFLDYARQKEFVSKLEETSYEFQAAWLILSKVTLIKRIRIIIFSNGRLALRKNIVTTDEKNGIYFSFSILDFSRYVDILNSRTGSEPIEIDLTELNSQPLPCLRAYSGSDKYASYLVAVPGKLLAEIYGMYGARLLEQNVRTFLQARTKVNKGIIDTIKNVPEMFFAYNNGLTATASAVQTTQIEGGGLGITSMSNLQIVNGGQTTASVLYGRDKEKANLDDVFVQMKLSVIDPEIIEDVVPKISRYANTQNKVSESDFFSSHPYHLEMEKISRRLPAPPREGSLAATKWFYERARGQYRDKQAYLPEGQRRRFQAEFPRDQLIVKTDLAKYETTFECAPHIVSQGAQKCFLAFAENVGKQWEKDPSVYNEGYFKNLAAKALVFRWIDRMVARSDWYKNDRGYKAQIVTYTLAWLIDRVRQEKMADLDLRGIWNKQAVPGELQRVFEEVAPEVAAVIKDAPENIRNVGEYCKRQLCWSQVHGNVDVSVGDRLKGCLIDLSQVKQKEKDDRGTKKIDDEIDFDVLLLKLAPYAEALKDAAKKNRLLSPNNDRALKKVGEGNLNLTRSEKNAMKSLLDSLKESGFELPE